MVDTGRLQKKGFLSLSRGSAGANYHFPPSLRVPHEITKYGIHSFTHITLAVDKGLTYRQDSAPDWLNKSSRQLVICIYRQRTNKLTKG